MKLLFCQNDSPIRGSFWQKDSLITHIFFELQPIMIFSPVANFWASPSSCCETWPAPILSQRFGKLKKKILRIQTEKRLLLDDTTIKFPEKIRREVGCSTSNICSASYSSKQVRGLFGGCLCNLLEPAFFALLRLLGHNESGGCINVASIMHF